MAPTAAMLTLCHHGDPSHHPTLMSSELQASIRRWIAASAPNRVSGLKHYVVRALDGFTVEDERRFLEVMDLCCL
uniref:Uncharacterized protein n=1 Tax=Kalanchoe fedtschenkoi TaxID=63787 RepID=A0A7N0T165_KALFE